MRNTKPPGVSFLTDNKRHNMKTHSPNGEEMASCLTDEEVNRIGKEKYEKQFAPLVNKEENYGKFFLLDVVTDKYEIGDNLLVLLKKVEKQKHEDNFYLCRIGSDSVFRL